MVRYSSNHSIRDRNPEVNPNCCNCNKEVKNICQKSCPTMLLERPKALIQKPFMFPLKYTVNSPTLTYLLIARLPAFWTY